MGKSRKLRQQRASDVTAANLLRHGNDVRWDTVLDPEIAKETLKQRNFTSSQLRRLHRNDAIDRPQLNAGERLEQYWSAFQLNGPKIMEYGEWLPPGYEPSQFAIQAQEDVRIVLRQVGEKHASILLDVCVFNYPPSSWATCSGLYRGTGVQVLRRALDDLSDAWQKVDRDRRNKERRERIAKNHPS